jgi:hypothetical protein
MAPLAAKFLFATRARGTRQPSSPSQWRFTLVPLERRGDQEFMQKLKKIVIIGGCGHVGLPLGIVFANCGLDVVLLDRDQAK